MIPRIIKNIITNCFLFLVLFISSTVTVHASDFYVSPSGNDTNSGNINLPFQTIQKAIDTATAGDTVYVRDGTYPEKVTINKSGTEDNYLTLTAYADENPIIDGQDVDYSDSENGAAIRIYEVSYIQVIGLDLRNIQRNIPLDNSYSPPKPLFDGPAGIRVARANHIILKNNKTYNTASSGIHVMDSSYITIDGNDVKLASNGGLQECISLDSVTNFEVMNNVVSQGADTYWGDEGIDIKMSSSLGKVYHNTVFDLPQEVAIYIDGYSETVDNIQVYNNTVYNTGEGIVVGAEQSGTAKNITLHHNIVHHVDGDGILVSDCCTTPSGLKENIKIHNNTLYANGTNYGGGITIRASNTNGIFVYNNIVSQNSRWQIRDKGEQADVDHNLINGFQNYDHEIYGTEYIDADPLFVDVGNNYFRLQENSPAIDTGIDLGYLLDFDENSIPSNYLPDLGAFEYQFTTTPPSPSPSLCSQSDIDQDGKVNLVDYSILSNDFFKSEPLNPRSDINRDGSVNIMDFSILSSQFLESC